MVGSAQAVDVRGRIVAAASKLLTDGGRDAVTTRAVAEAAGVQAPTIYRLFGDKRGLLEAVAAHGVASYLRAKLSQPPLEDPLQDLRAGWDQHVEFGLAHPAVYALMADPVLRLAAGREGMEVLAQRVHRVALAGRLRVSEERAVALIHAAGLGTVLALLDQPAAERDLELSAAAREAVISAITTRAPAIHVRKAASAAIALRAGLAELTELTARERDLLDEWLARIASAQ